MNIGLMCVLFTYWLLNPLSSNSQELSRECPPERFGPSCQYACHCKNSNNICDHVTGNCASRDCQDGYVGDGCQYVNLAFGGSLVPSILTDGDTSTCDEGQATSRRIDLGAVLWLRRIKVFVKESSRPKGLTLEISHTSNGLPALLSSSSYRMTWASDKECDVTLNRYVQGRYLYVRGAKLRLCEVFVFGGRNVAYLMPTSQSSTFNKFTSSLAVDGMTSQTLTEPTCSRTRSELFEGLTWWQVNLTSPHVISRILLHNPPGYLDRLRWFTVVAWTGSNRAQTIYTSTSPFTPPVISLVPDFEPWTLSGLQIQTYSLAGSISLCEVELFGDCPKRTYGPYCEKECQCKNPDEICDSFSGSCLSESAGQTDRETTTNGDKVGQSTSTKFIRTTDEISEDEIDTDNTVLVPTVATVVVVVIVVVVIVVVVVFWRRRKRSQKRTLPDAVYGNTPCTDLPISCESGVYEHFDGYEDVCFSQSQYANNMFTNTTSNNNNNSGNNNSSSNNNNSSNETPNNDRINCHSINCHRINCPRINCHSINCHIINCHSINCHSKLTNIRRSLAGLRLRAANWCGRNSAEDDPSQQHDNTPGDADDVGPRDANDVTPRDANNATPPDANDVVPGVSNSVLPGDANDVTPRDADVMSAAEEYEDSMSSKGTVVGAGGRSGVYEILGERDYETPYAVFKPGLRPKVAKVHTTV